MGIKGGKMGLRMEWLIVSGRGVGFFKGGRKADLNGVVEGVGVRRGQEESITELEVLWEISRKGVLLRWCRIGSVFWRIIRVG